MRSAVIHQPRQARIIDQLSLPMPGAGQVRIRLEGCGICGSNLPVWEGRPWFHYPFEPGAPGHEGWGIVDAVGDDVRDIEVGERVAALSYHAFAEYDIAQATCVVKLPAALDGQPFPGEALGCAMNVFRRCDLQPGQHVAIIGIGFMGALLTQLAVSVGAKVIAISRRTCALNLALQLGAIQAIPLDDAPAAVAAINRITGDAGCPRVIEATGHQQALDLAGELTAVRGRLVIAGYHQDGSRQVNMQQWNWRGIDVINAHERDSHVYIQGMRDAVHAVVRGTIDPLPLYTHTFALEEISDAFHVAETRPDGFLKALVLT